MVSGAHVLNRYYKSPQVFKNQKIQVGDKIWHKTGDTAYLKNNLLFLTGPLNSIINHGNTQIFPFVIENKLRQLRGIDRGSVVKIKDQLTLVIHGTKALNNRGNELSDIVSFDTAIFVSKIPMDARHQTKIDYIKLRKIAVDILNL
jgi:acyl-CoA synthetase (AMP-forming)/AMP-acid ligase II